MSSDPIVFIPLTQGKVAVIDFLDFGSVREWKWHSMRAGRRFYVGRKVKRADGKQTTLLLHRFLLPGEHHVDHRNGEPLDNRRSNLRAVNRVGNGQGFKQKALGKASKYRGVSWNSALGRWKARIQANFNVFHLGYFTDELEAARVRDAKALQLGYPIEGLNFPPP